jgi:hypothetical protein
VVPFLRKLAEHAVPLTVVVLLMGGSAVAGGLVTGAQIEDESITGRDVKDGSLTQADFRQLLAAVGGKGVGGSGQGGPKGVGGSPSCRTLLSCGGQDKGAKGEGAQRGPKGEKGERGAKGAKGDQGLQGAAGSKGDPGPPGDPATFVTEEVVKTTGKSTETPKELQVTCPNGPVISGGYVLAGTIPTGSLIARRSYAVAKNTWLVRAMNAGPSEEWELTVVATCATG